MTAEEILRKAGDMRRTDRGREYCSNAYFTVAQLEELLAQGHVRTIEEKDLLILLQKDQELYRLFFYAGNEQALRRIQEALPPLDVPVVLDIVGRDPGAAELAQKLCQAGFAEYSVFVRMVCKEPVLPNGEKAPAVELAVESDLEQIDSLMRGEFDPFSAHFPAKDELQAAIGKREITVIRQDGRVAGFAYFEKVSQRYVILRYFAVASDRRRQNIGSGLMYAQFTQAEPDTTYMLWVGTYNDAQIVYQKLGFQYVGLKDYILKFGG